MKILLFIFIFISNIFAAIITGDQSRVSVTGGSIDVTSGGVTQTVNSGQITFIGDGQTPSKPRKIQRGDLNNLLDNLKAKNPDNLISLKFPKMEQKKANKIKKILINKGIAKQNISIKKSGKYYLLKVKHIKSKLIKNIYPEYYKYAKTIEKKFKKKNKVPLIPIKLSHLKKYHKNIFRRK